MNQPVPTLAYSHEPKHWWVHRHWRLSIALCLTLLLAAAVCWFHESLIWRAKWIYWGSRCAKHVTPSGTVLFEWDWQKSSQLLATNRDYVNGNHDSGDQYSLAVYVPYEWRNFAGLLSGGGRQLPSGFAYATDSEAINFLGARRSADGHEWLVVIHGSGGNAYDLPNVEAVVYPMPSLFGSESPAILPHVRSNIARFRHARFLPAVADPSDQSHLSIEFKTDADGFGPPGFPQQGVVDINVQNGGSITFALRGPAPQ